jgi:dipeptidyl-peptidase-3
VDAEAFREGSGLLLAEIQRIKSEGDYETAKAFFEQYGTSFDQALRDEIVGRADALGLPSYSGFVMPELTPEYGPAGEIADVRISYPCDLATQMLDWSQRYRV